MSNRASNLLDINFKAVEAELADTESEFDGESEQYVKRVWLGTVFGLTPSGKIYTPFACSNVAGDCPVCEGSGQVEPRTKARIRKRAEARSKAFARKTLARQGESRQAYVARVKSARISAFNASKTECPCCYGSGSLSATKDELWNEALEAAAQEIDAYVDYFDDSVFVCRLAEEQE